MSQTQLRLLIVLVFMLAVFGASASFADEASTSVHLNQEIPASETYRTFEARGFTPADLNRLRDSTLQQWKSLFPVFVGRMDSTDIDQRVPMLGSYTMEDDLVRFVPRFPLMEGQHYSTFLQIPGTSEPLVTVFEIAKPEKAPTKIVQVYPTAEVLPENLFRFYFFFSSAMREGEALRHIRLFDAQNKEVPGVFLDTLEELWDANRTRLTLMFDPGRVKTGLRAHLKMGRALIPGENYRLVVSQGWKDAEGTPLHAPFVKRFQVASADLTPPTVQSWRITAPKVGTREPLSIRFPAPLDYVLASILLGIRDEHGSTLNGEIQMAEQETLWWFTPQTPWTAGRYELQVDGRLEDPAGNNLHGLFDRPSDQKLDLIKGKAASRFFEIL